ncbi:multicopper oxidase CueO [Sedimentitalea todarodis]|uniref:Multicopper oxidase CueO n=1 Tax=Sedimentitalea todarodis TaxID=1631240 RepID=A0ABU3VL74_9RHOB|nr:multicopper oxidase CueO [Sedimentitalea todarodis]MDU9006947.1 multicopper oxidase CueO [Sedimentitalea todarodis]
MTVTRRDFVQGGLATAFLLSGTPHRGRADQPRSALPIPQELRPDASGTIKLVAQSGTTRFGDRPPTPTYGVNGTFLGPAVRVKQGQKVVMDVHNALPEAMSLHWHGLIIPGDVDGGPHQLIKKGGAWRPTLDIDQPATTLWFHPHIYPSTAEMVIKGFAGLFIIDDDESDSLPLPSRWGVDDIPIVIQDRRFQDDGAFFHVFNLAAVTVGYVGDMVLVNGAEYPQAQTTRGWVRLRILNGSNARGYRLVASDGRAFHVIGSDGGLLEHPVSMAELSVNVGERYEIMVDLRDGKSVDFLSLPVKQMGMGLPPFDQPVPLFTLKPSTTEGVGRLPDRLATLPALPTQLPPVSQELSMAMFRDKEGMGKIKSTGMMMATKEGKMPSPEAMARMTDFIVNGAPLGTKAQFASNGINGTSFSIGMPGFEAARSQDLRWRIAEGHDSMLHPVHVHGCQFRILEVDGKPPRPHMAGWKDTVPISGGGSAEILLNFPNAAGHSAPYMAHCHILEHEDSGMMTQFTVA